MSSSRPKVNLRSTAVKRIMQEASELANANVDEDGFVAAPLEEDIFEWHCTMRGVSGSEYDGGLYHLRILLPPSYPMSAPDIILMTPNGRFELGKKICIDGLTSFHAGSWQPAWGVRTAVVGLRSFWMQTGEALSAIGALDYSKEERKRLANLSKDWKCLKCNLKNHEIISSISSNNKINQQSIEIDKLKSIEEKGNLLKDKPLIEDQNISINPNNLQEIPTIVPPDQIPTTISNTNTNASIDTQAIPTEIIPPALEKPPDESNDNELELPNDNTSLDQPSIESNSVSVDELPISSPPTISMNTIPSNTPTPTTSSNSVRLAQTPTPTPTQQQRQRSPVFFLIDSMILAGISILIMLIAKRMG
ncbi:uncharacterized protein I206_105498 [Kwoniella pini CBS 10737]|uniref:Ubiquitin-conjugating enzyme E2 J1 n=1 Tax=Kwoniella pini CBS 10737 TaxID=1296096 RepID=A0A1B9I428_9TREE|nr:ubiquitin-conjugating enzyme E2 J1 [Kwoniella pini CBS 10737]OCF50280.1 ubiquitin-conjugating enzyme E2 J1 [Kwoniella pini CBS 10737]